MDWVRDPLDDVELVRDIERVRSVGTEKKKVIIIIHMYNSKGRGKNSQQNYIERNVSMSLINNFWIRYFVISRIITCKTFVRACNWPRCVACPNMPQLKLGNFRD